MFSVEDSSVSELCLVDHANHRMNTSDTTFSTPEALVVEFKRQGHFDQIRKKLFNAFLQSDQHAPFRAELEAFLKEHVMAEADRMAYRDARLRHSDLMHALDKQPYLDQLVRDLCRNDDKDGLLSNDSAVSRQIRDQVVAMVSADASDTSIPDVS